MKLKDLSCDSLFTPISQNESQPLYHKGKDGIIRKVVGPNGGWNGFATDDLHEKEKCKFTPDTEVQATHICCRLFFDN